MALFTDISIDQITQLRDNQITLPLLSLLVATKRRQYLQELLELDLDNVHRRSVEKMVKRRPDLIKRTNEPSNEPGGYRKFVTLQRTQEASDILADVFGSKQLTINEELIHLRPKKEAPYNPSAVRKTASHVLQELAEKEGYKVLGPYKNVTSKLKMRCPNGREYFVTPVSFRKGRRCSCCLNKEKQKRYQELFCQKGYTLLNSPQNLNAHALLACPHGTKVTMNAGAFLYLNQRCRCRQCEAKKREKQPTEKRNEDD